MDFGGFICFGFGALLLLPLAALVIWLFSKRSPYRRVGLLLLGGWLVFLACGGLFLYREFVLNEGLVGSSARRRGAMRSRSSRTWRAAPAPKRRGRTVGARWISRRRQATTDALT